MKLYICESPFFSFTHSISLENKKYLNLQSGLWFTGLIETGLCVYCMRERETVRHTVDLETKDEDGVEGKRRISGVEGENK